MSLETELMGEFDAVKWASAFVATAREHPAIPLDEGTMIGWFANAIMAGYDRGRRGSAQADAQIARIVDLLDWWESDGTPERKAAAERLRGVMAGEAAS